MLQHKGTVVVYPVPFLCFSKEKNQKKGALFQGVFWARPKNQNRFTKFSTGIQKFFTQSNSYTGEKGVGMLRYSL